MLFLIKAVWITVARELAPSPQDQCSTGIFVFVLRFIASRLAPTWGRRRSLNLLTTQIHCGSEPARDEADTYCIKSEAQPGPRPCSPTMSPARSSAPPPTPHAAASLPGRRPGR